MQSKFYSALIIAAAVAGVLLPATQSVSADEVYTKTTTTTTTTRSVPEQTTVFERDAVVEGVPMVPTTPLVPTERVVVVKEQIVPITLTDAQVILQTDDLRRAYLDRTIIESRTNGTISESQAASFRRELDRIGAELTFLKGTSNPSLSRAIVLGGDLDALATSMRTYVTTIAYVPIIEGSHFTIFNGRIIQLDEPAVRRINLENKILGEQAAGKISFDQANSLRSDLNQIAAQEDAYRAKGSLTDAEARQIYNEMDHVAVKLERYEH